MRFEVINRISVTTVCVRSVAACWTLGRRNVVVSRTEVARVFPLKLEISPPSYELRYYRNIWSYVHWNFTAEIPADADLDSADDLENLRPSSQVGAQFPLCI